MLGGTKDSKPLGTIYTFYSFKGGVGRSMALANLAETFHEKGLRVLMVDWDLEAPGLEAYFQSSPSSPGTLQTPDSGHCGLMDLLLEYKTAYPGLAARLHPTVVPAASESFDSSIGLQKAAELADALGRERSDLPEFMRANPFTAASSVTFDELVRRLYETKVPPSVTQDSPGSWATSPIRAYVQCVHPPGHEGRNGLYLLSAGARGDKQFSQYALAVQEFDWSEFYMAYDGKQYFDWLRRTLGEIADVVLIDSRTGVTEMGGVCTRHLADILVSFCAPNNQNVNGIVRVLSGVNRPEVKQARDDERHVDILVVPSRIDLSESDRLDDFSRLFAGRIEQSSLGPEHPSLVPEEFSDLDRPLWNLQIPYIPRYNYGEERVMGAGAASATEVGQKLIEAYRRIAVHLAVLAPAGSRAREAYAGEIGSMFPGVHQSVVQMAPPVTEAWVNRPEAEQLRQWLLTPETASALRIGVWAPAGYGKTALVARVCRDKEIINKYPDGILWIPIDRRWSADTAQEWLRSCLGLGRSIGERGLRQLLANRRLLIVADDVWDPADIAAVLNLVKDNTQIVTSADLAVASAFGKLVLSIGALSPEQSAEILKSSLSLVEPYDPTAALAACMLRWPLGASLIRAAFDQRIAQRESAEPAWESIRQAFRRHQVLAFDQPSVTQQSDSAARSLRGTFGRLEERHKKLLIAIADRSSVAGVRFEDLSAEEVTTEERSLSVSSLPAGSRTQRRELGPSPVQRLANLGLVTLDESARRVFINPLVQAYLFAQGELSTSLGVGSRKGVSSSEDKKANQNQDVERAKSILHSADATLDEMQNLAEVLKDSRYFSYARRLFARCRQHPDGLRADERRRLKLAQRHALCTYRDPDLQSDARFSEALRILEEADLKNDMPSQETLGLAGAVCKNQWRLTGRRTDLEQSLCYYDRGQKQGIDKDFGYTGINAAFVHDVLATQEADSPDEASRRVVEARRIRTEIVSRLPSIAQEQGFLKEQWWYYATLAEACFGLGRYDDARFWLREGLALDIPTWQLESTTRQLAALAYAQDPELPENSEAWRTLRILVGDAGPALRAIRLGKVGLALSGGGFRASLFHIGVLACLAELDALRHVEVLSCVSGGSIVGAHYYLEVRRLLNSTTDRAISREDYITLVSRIEKNFLTAVQKNLRTRLFANLWSNLKTLFVPDYTRTKYMGELFERHIYSQVEDGERQPRWLNELYIQPKDGPAEFNPKLDNWRRGAKAPMMLLNATTLNTGHNWQFAVSWMGEPPLGASSAVDRNDILRRMYYWEAPSRHQRIRLGHAVAASACVPALFDPVEFTGLFPGFTVRLVDGGVHDNQGIAGLLEQECTMILVSDASGQANSDPQPSGEVSAVPMRSNTILMARVREAEFRELETLRRSSALNGLMFLHLKKDLNVRHLDWTDCQDPYESAQQLRSEQLFPLTSYGIQRAVQEALAGVRTDLDSFCDNEAYALMFSGYQMAGVEFARSFKNWPVSSEARTPWRFLSVEKSMAGGDKEADEQARLVHLLRAGSKRFGKVWRVAPWTSIAVVGALLLAVGLGAWPSRELISRALLNVPRFAGMALATLAGLGVVLWGMQRLIGSRKSMTVIATGMLMATVGWIAAVFHLLVLDPLYLVKGASDVGVAMRRLGRRWLLAGLILAAIVLSLVGVATL